MVELMMTIAFVVTMSAGSALVFAAGCWLWNYAFDLLLEIFKIKRLFVKFIYAEYERKHKRPEGN
jgi:hypothetical protein